MEVSCSQRGLLREGMSVFSLGTVRRCMHGRRDRYLLRWAFGLLWLCVVKGYDDSIGSF